MVQLKRQGGGMGRSGQLSRQQCLAVTLKWVPWNTPANVCSCRRLPDRLKILLIPDKIPSSHQDLSSSRCNIMVHDAAGLLSPLEMVLSGEELPLIGPPVLFFN